MFVHGPDAKKETPLLCGASSMRDRRDQFFAIAALISFSALPALNQPIWAAL